MTRKVFVDLDGVLANFDACAEAVLKTKNIYKYEFVHGTDAFWSKLHGRGDFFEQLLPMDDAGILLRALSSHECTVLTALPRLNTERADRQKRSWVGRYFPGLPVITCFTKDKPNYCEPGSILIDDRAVNRAAWEAKGGMLVLHTNAVDSITTLKSIGVL